MLYRRVLEVDPDDVNAPHDFYFMLVLAAGKTYARISTKVD